MLREIKIHPTIIKAKYSTTIDLSHLVGKIEMCLRCKGKGERKGRGSLKFYCDFCDGKGRVKFL